MKKIIVLIFIITSITFPLTYQYNGKSLSIDDETIEKAFAVGIDNFVQQYGETNEEELKTLIFNNILEQELLINSSYAKAIKIPESELETEFDNIRKEFPDDATFYRVLENQGFTKKTFLKEMEKKVLLDKAKEKMESTVNISEQEVKNYFDANKYNAFFIERTYDDVKKDIAKDLVEKKKGEIFRYFVENEIKKIVLPKNSEYSKYYSKIIYEKEGFKFSNIDFINRKIMGRIQGISDENLLKKSAKEWIDNDMKIVIEAKALKLKIPEKLSRDDKISAYKEAYQMRLMEITKVTAKELKKYFDINKENYFIPEIYDIDLIELPIKISEEDKKIAKDKAQDILNLALSGEDFEELAKKYSEDGSAKNGGNLGRFAKGQMVESFEKACFNGKQGMVIPSIVETEFGYHIIKVNDKSSDGSEVSASHILLMPSPSKNSKLETENKAKDIIEQINKKILTFSEATKYSCIEGDYSLRNIKKGSIIQNIGEDTILEEAISSAKVNTLNYIMGDRCFIFVKTKQTNEIEPTLENSMERVKYDLIKEKVSEKLLQVYN